jgi:hypothetical protein
VNVRKFIFMRYQAQRDGTVPCLLLIIAFLWITSLRGASDIAALAAECYALIPSTRQVEMTGSDIYFNTDWVFDIGELSQ